MKNKLVILLLCFGLIGFTLRFSTVNAEPEEACEMNACDYLAGAMDNLSFAYDLIDDINSWEVSKKFQAQRKLSKAYIKITYAQLALKKCGILGLDIEVNFDFNIIDPFLIQIDFETEYGEGNLTRELLLSVAKIIILDAKLDTIGLDTEDSLDEIEQAKYTIERVMEDIDC